VGLFQPGFEMSNNCIVRPMISSNSGNPWCNNLPPPHHAGVDGKVILKCKNRRGLRFLNGGEELRARLANFRWFTNRATQSTRVPCQLGQFYKPCAGLPMLTGDWSTGATGSVRTDRTKVANLRSFFSSRAGKPGDRRCFSIARAVDKSAAYRGSRKRLGIDIGGRSLCP